MSELSITFGELPEEDDPSFKDFWDRLQIELRKDEDEVIEHKRTTRDAINSECGSVLEKMEQLHFLVMDALNWSSETVDRSLSEDPEDDHMAELLLTSTGLISKSLLAFDEIIWLLRGGYPDGAWVRLRTLHEVYVVTSILTKYGNPGGEHPDLLERFRLHREVFTPQTLEQLRAAGGEKLQELLDERVDQFYQERRAELKARYGKQFSGQWGWASPLFKEGRPTFDGLNRLIQPSSGIFYNWSSHRIHASSEGWMENAVFQGERVISFQGSSTQQGLAAPAILATAHLISSVSLVIPTTISQPEGPIEDLGRLFLGALLRMAKTVQESWETYRD